jgi:invasion protein IalB
VRITSRAIPLVFASVLGLAAAVPAMAQQDQQPAQGQQPAPAQPNFGPRVKPAQPGAAPQAGQEQAPQAQTVATHGSWQIQCGEVPAQKDQPSKKQCGMVQLTKSEKNERVALSLIVLKVKQGDKTMTMMRVVVPIGVYLPTGVALEIDKAAVARVPFTRCLPRTCEAFAEASPPTIEKLKKGTAANFIIYEAPGLGIPMKISLDGFAAALDNLNKM